MCTPLRSVAARRIARQAELDANLAFQPTLASTSRSAKAARSAQPVHDCLLLPLSHSLSSFAQGLVACSYFFLLHLYVLRSFSSFSNQTHPIPYFFPLCFSLPTFFFHVLA